MQSFLASANIFVYGDFNAHNRDCLVHSHDTDVGSMVYYDITFSDN